MHLTCVLLLHINPNNINTIHFLHACVNLNLNTFKFSTLAGRHSKVQTDLFNLWFALSLHTVRIKSFFEISQTVLLSVVSIHHQLKSRDNYRWHLRFAFCHVYFVIESCLASLIRLIQRLAILMTVLALNNCAIPVKTSLFKCILISS